MAVKKKIAQTGNQTGNQSEATGRQPEAIAIPSWALGVVLVFTAIIYSRALPCGFTTFDDNFYVTANPLLNDFSWQGVKEICSTFYYSNYHPLTILVYLVQYKLFALDPLPYHLLNVFLHLVNIWLVFKIAERLSSNRLIALIVAILFAIHPMHVESVAWISELKDVLYSAFFLSSILFYIRYCASDNKSVLYITSLLLFILSLLSKSAAVTLPVVLLAIDFYNGRKISTRSLSDKVPFFLLSLLFGIINIVAFKDAGTLNDTTAYGLINKVFLCTYALQSYIVRAIIPYGLSAMHHFPAINNGYLPVAYYFSLPIILFLAWLLIRRSALQKQLIFGAAFFLITISVMLQILSFSSHLYAERYTYLSYIGLFYIMAQWIVRVGLLKWKNPVMALCALLAVVYSVQTWARIGVWKDSMTLFNDMIDKEPDSYFGYHMRANSEKMDGDYQAAMADYTTALNLNPIVEDAYYNRGALYDAMHEYKLAIEDYNTSIRLNPKLADVYNNRGWAYYNIGDTAAALRDLDKAISIKPKYAAAYNNRGWIHFQTGNMKAALDNYNKAIAVNPEFYRPRFNKAILNASLANYKEAIKEYNYLIMHDKEDMPSIYFYRGTVYLAMHDSVMACSDVYRAAALGFEPAAELSKKICK